MDFKVERLTYYYNTSKENILGCLIQTQKEYPDFKLEEIVDIVFNHSSDLYNLPLPLELYGDMIMALPYKDLVKACSVSKQFRRMCRTPEFVIKYMSMAPFEDQRKMVVHNIGRWSNELFDHVYKNMILGYLNNKERIRDNKPLDLPDDHPKFILESMYTLADEAKSIDYEEFKKSELKKKAQARLKTMIRDYGRFSHRKDRYSAEGPIREFYLLTLASILGRNPNCLDRKYKDEDEYEEQLKRVKRPRGDYHRAYLDFHETVSMLPYIVAHSNKYGRCYRRDSDIDGIVESLFDDDPAHYAFSHILLIDDKYDEDEEDYEEDEDLTHQTFTYY